MCAVAFLVSLQMPDSRKSGYLQGDGTADAERPHLGREHLGFHEPADRGVERDAHQGRGDLALTFKEAGYETTFFWYVTAMCAVAFLVSLQMPDSRPGTSRLSRAR
jgi:hypothetical protein